MTNNLHQPGASDAFLGGQNSPHGALVAQLDLMIRARRYPLLYIVSVEEEPVEDVLVEVQMMSEPERKMLLWDIVRGWNDNGADKGSVMGALNRIAKTSAQESTIFVLRDLHPIFKNPYSDRNAPVVREFKNLTRELKRSRKTLVLTSHTLELPAELSEEVTVIDFPLPTVQEIDYLISQVVVPEKLKVSGLAREQLVKACQGLSRARIQRVLALALAAKQQVDESDIDGVLQEKKQSIRQTGILEFFTAQQSLKSVGGLENLKQWVRMDRMPLLRKRDATAFPTPRVFYSWEFKAPANPCQQRRLPMSGDCLCCA